MHMKYFQAIADIKNHYDEIIWNIDNPNPIRGYSLLKTWDINPADKDLLVEEREVLRYLVGCRLGIVRGSNVKKPSLEVVQRCFKRQLSFLETIHKINDYNINKYWNQNVIKEYKACRHYLFQFSKPAWYEKLPIEILTFENKYPNF